MKTQKGAALIVVLSLLTISLMVGLSSIQSSQIDERLAGNYRAQADAQMAAEDAASQGWAVLESIIETNPFYQFPEGGSRQAFIAQDQSSSGSFSAASSSWCSEQVVINGLGTEGCYAFLRLSGGNYIAAKGGVISGNQEVSVSPLLLIRLSASGDLRNVINTVFECDASVDDCEEDIKFLGSNNEAADDIRDNKVSVNPDIFDDVTAFSDFLTDLKVLSDGEVGEPRLVNYFNSFGGNMNLSDYSGSIVVVDGDFTWGGRDEFEGILIVTGDVLRYSGAGSPSNLRGAIIHAPTEGCTGASTCEFSQPTIRIDGGIGDLEFDPLVVNSLLDRLDGSINFNPIEPWLGGYSIEGWDR